MCLCTFLKSPCNADLEQSRYCDHRECCVRNCLLDRVYIGCKDFCFTFQTELAFHNSLSFIHREKHAAKAAVLQFRFVLVKLTHRLWSKGRCLGIHQRSYHLEKVLQTTTEFSSSMELWMLFLHLFGPQIPCRFLLAYPKIEKQSKYIKIMTCLKNNLSVNSIMWMKNAFKRTFFSGISSHKKKI